MAWPITPPLSMRVCSRLPAFSLMFANRSFGWDEFNFRDYGCSSDHTWIVISLKKLHLSTVVASGVEPCLSFADEVFIRPKQQLTPAWVLLQQINCFTNHYYKPSSALCENMYRWPGWLSAFFLLWARWGVLIRSLICLEYHYNYAPDWFEYWTWYTHGHTNELESPLKWCRIMTPID